MHDELSPRGPSASAPRIDVAHAVLHFLLHQYPALATFEELVRELAVAPEEGAITEPFIRDGVADLVGHGLAHRLEGFLLASRAAVRANELAG